MSKIALIATGLLLVGGAIASPGTPIQAAEHAAAKAKELASGNSVFHRNTSTTEAGDNQCDVYRNHGAYVSSVAQNASRDHDNASRDEDRGEHGNQSGNKTHDHNETGERERAHREHNETREHDDDDNETEPRDESHGGEVSEAAHSDIGKCGGSEKDNESKASHEDDDHEEKAEENHGRSSEARSEHPPRNDERE